MDRPELTAVQNARANTELPQKGVVPFKPPDHSGGAAPGQIQAHAQLETLIIRAADISAERSRPDNAESL